MWEAADVMQQMRREGFTPDIHSYTAFVNSCCKAGDMQVSTVMCSTVQVAQRLDAPSKCARIV